MKTSFSTLGCPKFSFRDVLSIAKDLGYDGVEVRGLMHVIDAPDIPEFSQSKISDTRQKLEELGLEIPILTSACYLNIPGRWEEIFKMAARYVDTAALLGAKYVRLLGDVAAEPTILVEDSLVAEHAAQAAEYAEKKGIEVLIETNGAYADSARLKKVIEQAGRPNIGALWDINHTWHLFSEKPEQTLSNIGKFVRHVHLKDSVLCEGKISYCIMGQGELPIKQMVQLLTKNNYQGYYSLEWVKRWETNLEEPGITFDAYQNYMRNLEKQF